MKNKIFILGDSRTGTSTLGTFLKALGVDLYPSIVFINGCRDKIIYDVTGYRDSKKMMTILDYISSKSYKKITLEDFKDELFFDE